VNSGLGFFCWLDPDVAVSGKSSTDRNEFAPWVPQTCSFIGFFKKLLTDGSSIGDKGILEAAGKNASD